VLRHHVNGSHWAVKDADPWTEQELDEVILAVRDFPSVVFPVLGKTQTITHFKRGYTLGRETLIANATVSLFDPWNDLDPALRRSTLIHELGHSISVSYGLHASPAWLALSGWTQAPSGGDASVLGNPGATVSLYGQTNASEDFAESVVAYRYRPELLRRRSPQKYAFLRELVFDGREYFEQEGCEESPRNPGIASHFAKESKSLIDRVLRTEYRRESWLGAALQQCGKQVFESLGRDSRFGLAQAAEVEPCIARLLGDQAVKEVDFVSGSGSGSGKTPYEALRFSRLGALFRKVQADRVREPLVSSEQLGFVRRWLVAKLEALFVQLMAQLEKDRRVDYLEQLVKNAPIPGFCAAYSRYASHPAVGILDPVLSEPGRFVTAQYREVVNRFAEEVCLDLHRGKRRILPPRAFMLEARVRARFQEGAASAGEVRPDASSGSARLVPALNAARSAWTRLRESLRPRAAE
jgi:hypothetical protein